MNITYRPIDTWPGEQTKVRQASPFSTRWDDTLALLDRELRHLRAKNVVFQIALREQDFRLTDGQPRANARAEHPGVVLAFDSKHGPLKYACDTYVDFQSNVRAIALGLEALRKVDRYGITKRGEQYKGWKALPAAGESTSTMSVHDAAAALVAASGLDSTGLVSRVLADPAEATWVYRAAIRKAHPDAGGDPAAFHLVQEAKRILDAHHGRGR